MTTPAQVAADGVDKLQSMMNEFGSLFAQGLSLPFKAFLIPMKAFETQQTSAGFAFPQMQAPNIFTTNQGEIPKPPALPPLQVPQGMQALIPQFKMNLPDGSIQSVPGIPVFVPQGIQSLPPAPPGAEWKIELGSVAPPEMPAQTSFGTNPNMPQIMNIAAVGPELSSVLTL